MVNRDLALDLDLFSRGGLEILRAIERHDYDVLTARPAISKAHQGVSSPFAPSPASCCHFSASNAVQPRPADRRLNPTAPLQPRPSARTTPTLIAAPSPDAKPKTSTTPSSRFPSLAETPSAPSTPSCARPTTSPTTSPSPSRERRRSPGRLDFRLAPASAGAPTADPVFLAVRDATQRFNIPLSLLDELVAGVTMDLESAPHRRSRHLRNL